MGLLGKAWAIGSVAVIVFGLSACTSHDDAASSSQTETPAVGPLDEFTLRIWGRSANETEADMASRLEWEHRWTQDYVSACMNNLGFTYIPDISNPPQVLMPDGPLVGTREFAEQFGFGISNEGLWSGTVGVQSFPNTANDEMLNSMSDAERDAWNLALYGNWGEFEDLDDADINWGCANLAQRSLRDLDSEESAVIQDEIRRFDDNLAVSPEMLSLDGEWASCMANLGHAGYRNPNDLLQTLRNEWNSRPSANNVMLTWDWETYPDGPPEQEASSITDNEQSFSDWEITLAIADIDCQEQVNYQPRSAETSFRAQEEFVEKHRADLEAWELQVLESRQAPRVSQ